MNETRSNGDPFWAWLVQQQEEHHMTLRQIALRAGLSGNVLYQIRSREGLPSVRTCRRLAQLFAVDEDYVLALAGHRSAKPNYDLRQVLQVLYPQVPPQRIDQALGALYYVLGESTRSQGRRQMKPEEAVT